MLAKLESRFATTNTVHEHWSKTVACGISPKAYIFKPSFVHRTALVLLRNTNARDQIKLKTYVRSLALRFQTWSSLAIRIIIPLLSSPRGSLDVPKCGGAACISLAGTAEEMSAAPEQLGSKLRPIGIPMSGFYEINLLFDMGNTSPTVVLAKEVGAVMSWRL